MGKISKIIAVNILVFLVLLLLLEAGLQLIAFIRPSYDVLFLQPDRDLGWKQVPNLQWIWAGHYWYAADFSVNVQTNALGFRDIMREVPKSRGIKRVALIGDSFIEAVQVPLQKTAGQILQQHLNGSSKQDFGHSAKWEVLNFGISNYSVGQYLLVYEKYVNDYDPDYVAIFVTMLHMKRTIKKYEFGAFRDSTKEKLWVRPTFRLENDALIREPATDIDEFIKIQQEIIQKEFAGQRSRRKKHLITYLNIKRLCRRLKRKLWPEYQSVRDPDAETKLLSVNLRIIHELGRQVANEGGKLVVLDPSQYFGDSETVSGALKELCHRSEFGYIPVYEDLLKAKEKGIATMWPHDSHLNETGNEILADALFKFIEQD